MYSIVANGVAMLVAKLLPPIFAFMIHVTVARLAGAETLGAYVYLLAVLMIFQAVAGSGMQFLVTRELAAHPDDASAYLQKARSFALVSGLAATAGYLLYALLVLPSALQVPAMLLSLTLLPSAWIAIQESVFIATRTHHRITIVAIIENTIKMSGAVGALATGHGLVAVCGSIALARLTALAAGSVMLARAGFLRMSPFDRAAIRPFALSVAPFAALFVVSMTYFRIDVPIVQALLGKTATGFYGAAATLYGAVLLIPESAMATAYPRLAAGFRASRDGYGAATLLLAKLLALALVPLSIVIMCLAEPIVTLAYGHRFPDSAPVLRILALSLPIHAVNGALGQALQAAHYQRAMLGIVTGGLIVHVALNIVLVRGLGIQGGALALVLSSSCVAAGALWTVHRRIAAIRLGWRSVAAVLPIAGPLALVLIAPAQYRLLAGIVGLVWLGAGSAWHGTLGRADIAQIRRALRPAAARATA